MTLSEAVAHHRIAIRRKLGSLHLDIALNLCAPWSLIYGPSGSGKSSILHAMCGSVGRDGIEFTRTASSREEELISPDHAVATHQLGLSYSPQNPVLFPHMRVLENITFGSTCRGLRAQSSSTVTELLDVFELEPLLLRRSQDLSGGERQRVSLARAFAVPATKLLLLDEPFSGVDRAMRDRILPRMVRFLDQRGIPVLSVSHDADEALLLKAEVVRLKAGKVTAQGPAAEVLADEVERLRRALSVPSFTQADAADKEFAASNE